MSLILNSIIVKAALEYYLPITNYLCVISVVFECRREIGVTMKSSIIKAISLSTFTFTLPLMMFVVFSVYGALEGVEAVTLRKVFITLSLLTLIKNISNLGFLTAINNASEGLVAYKRIKVSSFFLLIVKTKVWHSLCVNVFKLLKIWFQHFLLHKDLENSQSDADNRQNLDKDSLAKGFFFENFLLVKYIEE